MLTPRFEVQQDETHVTVKIFAPYTQIADAEVSITEDVFTFYSSPYYLRLSFSGRLVDSELEEHSAKFDADTGVFIIACKKETPGEHFANLDLLTVLLTPKGATGVNRPLIEVIGSSGLEQENVEDDDFDFTYEQTLPEEGNTVTEGHKYGFGNSLSGIFSVLQSELKGVVDINDPDNKSATQRRKERIAQEMSLFDEDHYLADYFDVDMTQQFIEFIPEFYSITSDEVEFSQQDKEDMLQLPRKEHLMDKGTKSIVFLGLADILYAWCYNHRITLGDNSVESAWNVAKLSSTLSWLDSFTSLGDVALSSIRRSLTFPLVRNWLLSQQVLKDTAHVLSLGKKKVLKCLFEVRRFFNSYEPRYILNQLYIDDYCIWLQKVKENKLISLSDSLRKVRVTKADVGLDLDDLETVACFVLKEEESLTSEQNINNIVSDIAGLTIIENGAVMGVSDSEALPQEPLATNSEQQNLAHLSDSDSSSSDSEEESDDTSDSSDSSDDSSDDSDVESSSDSSELDSDDETVSENNDN